jgi:hypothetical protein
MTLTGWVEPDSHDTTRRGIVKDLVGSPPVGLRPIALSVTAYEEADEKAHDNYDDDDQHNYSHLFLLLRLKRDRRAVGDNLGHSLSDLG